MPVLFNSRINPELNNWRDFGCFTYYRDYDLEKKVKDAAIDFWHNNILKKIPPSCHNIKDANRIYPTHVEFKEVIANSEIANKVTEYSIIYNKIKELEKQEATLKLELMEFMQDAEKIKTETGYEILWKSSSQQRLDIQALKLEHPEIYNEYLKKTESRTFKLIMRNEK